MAPPVPSLSLKFSGSLGGGDLLDLKAFAEANGTGDAPLSVASQVEALLGQCIGPGLRAAQLWRDAERSAVHRFDADTKVLKSACEDTKADVLASVA